MAYRGPEIPYHHERQLMQRLEGAGWVKAATVQSTPGFIEKLLAKGWIEKSVIEGRLCYRITDQGLAARRCRSETLAFPLRPIGGNHGGCGSRSSLGEMHELGVRGLFVHYSDYRGSHSIDSAPTRSTDGRTTSGFSDLEGRRGYQAGLRAPGENGILWLR